MANIKTSFFIFVVVSVCLLGFTIAQQGPVVTCPNYRYKCPDCKDGQFCTYPLNHGCEKSGVPVCQAKNCHNIVCAPKALPCPDECPFSCKYNGPPCCPFIGQPTCLPPCQTFVECKITPCPDDCPNDCFYPNADYCCPKSGEPVCRSQIENVKSNDEKRTLLKRGETLDNNSALENTDDDSGAICIDMIVPCPPQCPQDCEYPTNVPCPRTHQPKCRSTINPDGTRYSDDEVAKKFNKWVKEYINKVKWLNQQHKSPTSASPH